MTNPMTPHQALLVTIAHVMEWNSTPSDVSITHPLWRKYWYEERSWLHLSGTGWLFYKAHKEEIDPIREVMAAEREAWASAAAEHVLSNIGGVFSSQETQTVSTDTERKWREGLLQGYLWTDIINANDHTIIKVKTHKMVRPYASEPDPEGMANLALVKAAPRLFDALKAIAATEPDQATDHRQLTALFIAIARTAIEEAQL